MNKKVFILPEIYGVNDFIHQQASQYQNEYTTVEYVSLSSTTRIFPYTQEEEAYHYFIKEIGFDSPLKELTRRIEEATIIYDAVVVIGFSVGAALAWRLSTLPIQQVICVYGSRIRQYLDTIPSCPTLVILPTEEKSFDVQTLKEALTTIPNTQVRQFSGQHGFMDKNNANYCATSCTQAQSAILHFLSNTCKGDSYDD
ncbi:hypothetical protein LYSBPC_12360 [Lysinibacillus piscis]|uniref:Dienelactone hydrolase domain-containing protein n=2 Tax=Lysinibacillus piscis TaxID=2518931 RepID=A0ABQ5NIJ9_9BACI|nr:hypothetical protein LYSBPC_12360 [Lysinibacillus sp. KH24]